MTHSLRAALLAAAVLSVLPGCTAIAHTLWPCPTVGERSRLSRETPDAAVDFLIDAFRNRRIADIYETFHPEFVRENGEFDAQQFGVAYEKFEPDFTADATSLAGATREWRRDPPPHSAVVRLANSGTGAEVRIAFEYRPKIRVLTKNPFVGLIEGTIDKASVVGLENGHLRLPADFDLATLGVAPETAAKLTSDDVVRIDITDDWVVRAIQAKNLRILDQLKEHTGK